MFGGVDGRVEGLESLTHRTCNMQALELRMQREAANAVLELARKINATAPIGCLPAQPTKTVYLGAQVCATCAALPLLCCVQAPTACLSGDRSAPFATSPAPFLCPHTPAVREQPHAV